jgi:asparaginyl-tRNA synthetase
MTEFKHTPNFIKQIVNHEITVLKSLHREQCVMPKFDPVSYTRDIPSTHYFDILVSIRHFVQMISHYYFSTEQQAKNVDLFMMTSSVSSPMGPGSDSEPIQISFGGLETNLVDSSQFGFEPLLLKNLNKVYCYLPSMRGENPDTRHLNQFFHCEFEMIGQLDDVMKIAETYIKRLAELLMQLTHATDLISDQPENTQDALESILAVESFPRVTFDEAADILLHQPNHKHLLQTTSHGRDITAEGESELLRQLGYGYKPVWITHYDRDRAPFYQKPSKNNTDKVENADLLLPALRNKAFGGEVLGAGQRQDSVDEMIESLKRQNGILPEPYEWYINLRRIPGYNTTAGFGLGIERFLAWILCKSNIRDVSLYPRIKGLKTYP